MNPMQQSLRGYALVVLIVWAVLCIAAIAYSQQKDIPLWVAAPVVPAFLVEAALYIASGFAGIRAALEKLPRTVLATLMTISGVVPYLVYAIPTGVFRPEDAAGILLLASVASFWYVLAGRRTAADAGFLILMALPVLLKLFPSLYPDPIPRLSLHVLGVLMWYRLGIVAVLVLRKMGGIGFSFLPRPHEWWIGLRNFAIFLPVGFGIAVALQFVPPRVAPVSLQTVAIAIVTFFVTLWVLAVAEEFFFRGLLQQLLTRKLGSEAAGILVASVVFGAVHLGFRRFPNWDFAILAACAGVFYGLAYSQAKSIRAAMVTHALVVTTWRVFLF
jgi:membrane protease YdiL (CAAX protease family)